MSVQAQPEDDDLFLERKQFDLKKRLGQIVLVAHNVVVNNEEAFRQITALYAESKDWEKQIEFARKNANAPDQDRINTRNDKAKEILAPLKEIQTIAKTKSGQYQMMLEEIKQKEAARIKEAIDLIGSEEMPYIPPAEKIQRGEGAIAYTRMVRKFRIVDEAKLPDRYWRVNEDAIASDMKLGINEIPGVEIYEEKVTQLKTR